MTRYTINKAKSTEEGRLLIKKIRKYKGKSRRMSLYEILTTITAILGMAGGIISLAAIIEDEYLNDSPLLTFGVGVATFTISAISMIIKPLIREAKEENAYEAISFEEELYAYLGEGSINKK